ncbi:MAG: hypothetical protein U0Q03_17670 [Acidimicrobiales bacterium]
MALVPPSVRRTATSRLVPFTGGLTRAFGFTPRQLLRGLLVATAILTVLGAVADRITRFDPDPAFIPSRFDLLREGNVPTWFASGQWLLAAVFALRLAVGGRRTAEPHHRTWTLLAAVFLFCSIDEAAQFHEPMSDWMGSLKDASPVLANAWVVPYAVAVVVIAIMSWRLVRSLPSPVFRLLVLSGVVFVGGAIGFELIESVFVSEGKDTLLKSIVATGQEVVEMLGLDLLVFALAVLLDSVIVAETGPSGAQPLSD